MNLRLFQVFGHGRYRILAELSEMMKFLFRGQPHDPHTPIPTILFGPLSDHGSCNKKDNKNFLCHSNIRHSYSPLFRSVPHFKSNNI